MYGVRVHQNNTILKQLEPDLLLLTYRFFTCSLFPRISPVQSEVNLSSFYDLLLTRELGDSALTFPDIVHPIRIVIHDLMYALSKPQLHSFQECKQTSFPSRE